MNRLAFDIETDTSPLTDEEIAAGFTSRGLDPRITTITEISVATDCGVRIVLSGDEAEMLWELDRIILEVEPDLLVTWNGAVFDLPFINDRAALAGAHIGLQLTANPNIIPKYQPTPGHEGGYDATWNRIPHADIAYLAKEDAEATGVSWSLKPYAKSKGLEPIEVDRERMHELTPEERKDYALSDAVVTLVLAQDLT